MIISILILYSNINFAQNGCTDPNAVNYTATAKTNDGSCTYASTVLNPEVVCTIDDKINETSGLIFWRGKPWTHNDSGGDPFIYAIDTITGAIIQTVKLIGAKNEDWEDISQDKDYIYIGEMGNNNGTRKNLKILRIKKAEIPLTGDISLTYDSIKFRYKEQLSFASSQDHNFDCEGFIFYKDSIHIFTKNRGNTLTYHYVLNPMPSPEEYVISRKDSFNVNGQVTGADINTTEDKIALTGYINLASPHIWLFFDFIPEKVFSGNKRRIELPGPQTVGQMEAVCFKNEHDIFLSNEALPGGMPKQMLFRANTAIYTENNLTNLVFLNSQNLIPSLYPNPSSESIVLENMPKQAVIEMYNTLFQKENLIFNTENQIDISKLEIGIYFISIETKDSQIFLKFLKK